MEVVLVMFKADGQRKNFPLTRDVTVIGRREDCDLRIPLTEISRKHCRLVKEADHLRLEDLGSSNGTYHNGIRVQETLIQPGDQLQVGPVQFTVQIDGFPPEASLRPPQPASEPQPSSESDLGMPVPSNGSNQTTTGTFSQRAATPGEGEDFAIAADEDDGENNDDDVIDLLGSSDDDDSRK